MVCRWCVHLAFLFQLINLVFYLRPVHTDFTSVTDYLLDRRTFLVLVLYLCNKLFDVFNAVTLTDNVTIQLVVKSKAFDDELAIINHRIELVGEIFVKKLHYATVFNSCVKSELRSIAFH